MLRKVNSNNYNGLYDIPHSRSYDMAAKSTDMLPFGCPILTTIFVVDKVGVVFCDGEDNWYREADKPVAAGQPISALF